MNCSLIRQTTLNRGSPACGGIGREGAGNRVTATSRTPKTGGPYAPLLIASRSSSSRAVVVRSSSASSPAAEPWKTPGVSADTRNDISVLANEEVVLLLFQLELDTQLQRALNYEAFDIAQEIRRRRDEVDSAARKVQEKKGDKSGAKGASQMQAMDMAAEGLRLRSELQRAIEEERYSDAAKLRDQLKDVDSKMKGTSAVAGEWNLRVEPRFKLGQRVLHATKNFRGVVVGFDYGCCETEEFVKKSGAGSLSRGLMQPFYRVLVDMRDAEPLNVGDSPTAYVAEECLTAPQEPETWRKKYGQEGLHHPYLYLLFYGFDNDGNLIPCKALRELYGQKRRDVPPPKEEGEPQDEDQPKPYKGGDGPLN